MHWLWGGVVVTALLSFFLEGSVLSFVAGVALVFWGFAVWGVRNTLVAVPLFLSLPAAGLLFERSGVLRGGLLFALIAVLFWFFSDTRQRARGAPLSVSRIQFFFLSGTVVLVTGAAAAADAFPLRALFTVMLLAGTAMIMMRLHGERARAAYVERVPLFADAVIVAFLGTEFFVSLSFLPLSFVASAASFTVILWGLMAATLLARLGLLTGQEMLRVGGTVAGMLGLIFVSVPWFAA